MSSNSIVVTMAAVLVAVMACGLGCMPPGEEPESLPVPGVPADEPKVEAPPSVPDADLKALAEGNNAFAIDLYKKLAAESDGNIVVSPYSIRTALAMTYAGARGETAEEMRKVLHFILPDDKLHPAQAALDRSLRGESSKDGPEFLTANALWGQRGLPFRDEFLRLTRDHYGAGLRQVDFDRTETARKEINGWVLDQTRGKIPELLNPQDLPPNTLFVLTNAVYFRGDWLTPFEKAQTREEVFEPKPGAGKPVPTMCRAADDLRCYVGPTFQVLDLPYAGERLSLVVLLPTTRFGLRAVEEKLTSAELEEVLKNLAPRQVLIALPRFSFKTRYELSSPLHELGRRRPFLGGDFSWIGPGVNLARVIHAGCVEVDERGTEAAAATAVVPEPFNTRPLEFRADQPFLFLIRDHQTGAVLFLGRVADPI